MAMKNPFRKYLPDVKLPPEFQRSFWRAFFSALGAVLDYMVGQLKAGVKSRFPSTAADDALEAIGAERQILRGPGDTTTSYAARLRAAWDIWTWAGRPYGVLQALRSAGYPTARLCIVNGWQYHLDGDGALVRTRLHANSYSTRATRTYWNEFDVVIDQPLPASWYVGPQPNLPVVASNYNEDWNLTVVEGTKTTAVDFGVKVTSPNPTPAYVVTLDGGATWSATPVAVVGGALVDLDTLPGVAAAFPAALPTGVKFRLNTTTMDLLDDRAFVLIAPASKPVSQYFSGNAVFVLEGAGETPAHALVQFRLLNGATTAAPSSGDIEVRMSLAPWNGVIGFVTEWVPFVRGRMQVDSMPVATGTYFTTYLSFWGEGLFTEADEPDFDLDRGALLLKWNVPGDDSDEARLMRFLVRTWAPAHASFNRVVLREGGQLFDYPNVTCAEATAAGVTWGESKVHFWTGTK